MEPTEIKTIVGPSVVEQVIPTAAPISTIPMVSLEKNETKKNLGLIVEDANGVSVYPSIVQPVNASLEVTDHKSLITGLSLPPVPMTDSASKPTPPNLDSVAANIVSPSEPLIPKNTETDKDISEIERHAIEDRLLNLHRSFALVTQRLGVYEEALASKVSNSKDVSSFNENNVPSLLPDVLIIKNQEADSTSFASVTALKDEGIKENQKIPPKNLDIIGVGNLAEFSKKRNNLERLHNAAFKIQVFYKKQKLRRSMVGKSRAKSPNRSPTYAHGRDLLFHDLLQKVHPREREKEIDGSLRPLKSSQGFEFKTSPSLGNRNPSDSNHTESVISPVINITNYLGLSAISKTLLPQSESKIAGEEKIPPKLVNSKPKLEESVPFVIPKNFKHSILNLYTKYIAKSGASELLGLKSTDQSVPQIQKPQSSLNLEEFIQPTLPPESLIFNNEEPAVSNRVPEISPSHLNVMRSETPDAAGIEKKVDSEVSDVSELSEALYSSFNQIKSPSNYISKSHSAEELRSTSFYDYENESFESLPSNNAPASPPLKQIREVPKTFTPGDVFARQKRDLMGMDGLARLAPLALGRK